VRYVQLGEKGFESPLPRAVRAGLAGFGAVVADAVAEFRGVSPLVELAKAPLLLINATK
jgi:hypothetical protein